MDLTKEEIMKTQSLACLVVAILVGATGCVPPTATVYLMEGAGDVKVFRKTDPPAICREVGAFTAVTGHGCGLFGLPGNYTATYNQFRNQVVQLGGNAGLIEHEIPPHAEGNCGVNAYVMNGIAYNCPQSVIAGTTGR